MKIQELAIILIIIILPISIVLSVYTQYQIDTLNTQTLYDSKLTAATYDAIKAFQLNTTNSTISELYNSKIRDIEASVATFKNSIMSTFELNGYTEEQIEQYIPALVYTMYDGFYIYSPYENTNYLYEYARDKNGNIKYDTSGKPIYKKDASGKKIPLNNNGETMYGLKPYITYSCRYKNSNVDIIITYSLDNYIQIQGTIGGKYVNDGGYLIDDIDVDETNNKVTYNGISIQKESLTEYVNGKLYPYIKISGTKYYYDNKGTSNDSDDEIFYISNGKRTIQGELRGVEAKKFYKSKIEKNDIAQTYYKEAYEFTTRVRDVYNLDELTFANAYDEIIQENGKVVTTKLWPTNTKKIFKFSDSKNIEDDLSNFNQHRLAVIRNKIETNLAIAISNYNKYSKAEGIEFQMPELKEDEWDLLLNNISLISFVQGFNIGGKIYNGYTVVNNSQSKEVILEENILILGKDGYYHKIGDKYLESGANIGKTSEFDVETKSAGRLNLDFERKFILENANNQYYYPLKDYYSAYDSIVTQNNVTLYESIYTYIDEQKDAGNTNLAEAFYTALGRERTGAYNSYLTDISEEDITEIIDEYKVKYVIYDNEVHYSTTVKENSTIEIIGKLKGEGIVTFKGWKDKETGQVYQPGEKFYIDGDTTFVAVCEYKKFEVTYNANGGKGTPPIQEKTYGKNLTLSTIKPTKTGYTFIGWSTEKDNTVEYYAGGTYTENKKLTLYAVYGRNYTVTYTTTLSSVKGMPASETKVEGIDLTLTSAKPTKTGYTFIGWSKDNNKSVEYKVGGIYKDNADITLYAVFGKNYTVKYNANEGKNPPKSQTKVEGIDLTLTSDKPTRTGWVFNGWKDKKTGTIYEAGGTFKENKDVTLYAQWKREKYKVEYDANGGKGAPSSQNKEYGKNLTLSKTKPTRTGHKFQGWGLSSTATKVTYKAGGTYKKNEPIKLFAVWKADTYKVTYNANGGKNAPKEQTKTYGVNLELTSKIPTRTGYKFIGWATSAKGSVEYEAGGTYTENKKVTLFAKWQKISVTGVSLNKTSAQWIPKSTYGSVKNYITLKATVSPSNALNKSVTWSSSDTSVATVSSAGKVTAKGAGKTTITVKSADNKKIKASVDVYVYNAVYDWGKERDLYKRTSSGTPELANEKFPVGTDYLILDSTSQSPKKQMDYSYYAIRYSKNNSKFNIQYDASGVITSKYWFKTQYQNGKNLCKKYFKVIEDGLDIDLGGKL